MRIRLGADGVAFGEQGHTIADQALRTEAAGFDSFWIGDHIISPATPKSRYPYSLDGSIPWAAKTAMYEAVVAASVAAAHTQRVDIAFGVLVVPLRHPLILAKQLATLDRLSNGRVILGCGAGWLSEEYAALQVPFESRQTRLVEWIHLLRACWTGQPGIQTGEHYSLEVITACYPTPARPIPILIGGTSPAALELAGQVGDGWYPILPLDRLQRDWLEPRISQIRLVAAQSGRDPNALRFVVYAEAELDSVARCLPTLIDLGIGEVVVAVDWTDAHGPERVVETLRRVAG